MVRRQAWILAAFAVVMFRLSALEADTVVAYVRSLSGDDWPASVLAYHAAALVITASNGRSCALSLERVDWEATARRNVRPIDLLRLPETEASASACEAPAASRAILSRDSSESDGTVTDGHGPAIPPHYPPSDVERYRAIAVRSAARPVLDGVLDDTVWRDAIPFSEFFQSERHVGEPASERTEVRILYDEDSIYFGIRAYDSRPDLVVARNMIRDGALDSDDTITILLDPLHDHRTAYVFGTNPNGMRVDANLVGSTQGDLNSNWDGVWNVAARRDGEGWTAEFQIPLTTVRFRTLDMQTWGLAVERRIARKNERAYWPFISNNSTFYRPPQAGHLTGLRRLHPGANVRLTPYVAGGAGQDYVAGKTDRVRSIGFDATYWPTPTLTTTFTVNTDFAQTEVDNVQINLTQFPLYYREKRQFFLEGGRVFDFGGAGEAQVFYSRRIGLSNGQAVPIVAGGRLTGKAGPYYVGALVIRTADQGGTPAADAYVARVSRDVFERSRIGAIFTEQRTANGDVNQVVGVDANLYRGNAFSFQGFVAKVIDPRLATGTIGGRASLGWNTDLWGLNFAFLDLQDHFQPALGFIPRPGMFCYVPSLRFSPRPNIKWIRRTYVQPTFAYHPTQQGVTWTRTDGVSYQVELENGDNITLRHNDEFERLLRPFAIRSNQSIPVGTYSFGNHGLDVATFTGRKVQGSVSWTTGRFYDGERTDLAASTVLRFNEHFSMAPGVTRSDVVLPRGAFTAVIATARSTYTFTPNVSVSSLTQWDNDSGNLVANVRFNYILKPGANVYVVYTEADQTSAQLSPRNRSLIAKVNYILDF